MDHPMAEVDMVVPDGSQPTDASRPLPADFAVGDVERSDGQVVISVRGEVDMASAPSLWQHFEAALPDATQRLVVDLSETTFIDSAALGVFVRAFKRLRHAGADLVLRSPSRSARKVFTVTGLDRVMTIEGEAD